MVCNEKGERKNEQWNFVGALCGQIDPKSTKRLSPSVAPALAALSTHVPNRIEGGPIEGGPTLSGYFLIVQSKNMITRHNAPP